MRLRGLSDMDKIIINIDNVYRSDYSLFSQIYISNGVIDFPNDKWADFTDRILVQWTDKIITYQFEKKAKFRLYFIESNSNRMDIYKNNEKLSIKCIEYDECHENCLYQFECYYIDFLKALSKSISKFAYLLYNVDFEKKYHMVYLEMLKYKNVINKIIKTMK